MRVVVQLAPAEESTWPQLSAASYLSPARLVCKAILLAGLAVGLQLAIFMLPPPDHLDYLDSSLDKQALLAGPEKDRVLFAGGSNVAFGVDSYGVEKAADRYAINLGLHAELGLRYMMKEVQSGAKAGDLVVLSPEYEHFFGTLANSDVTALQLLQDNHDAWRYFTSWGQLVNLARNIGNYNLRKGRSLLTAAARRIARRGASSRRVDAETAGLYSRSSFNDRGDMVKHLDEPQPNSWRDPITRINEPLDPHLFKEIDQMAALLESRGVGFCIVYPAVAQSWWRINGDKVGVIADRLKGFAANTPESSVYDDGYFFDTYYHLNRPGRDIRTKELSAIVKSGCHPIS